PPLARPACRRLSPPPARGPPKSPHPKSPPPRPLRPVLAAPPVSSAKAPSQDLPCRRPQHAPPESLAPPLSLPSSSPRAPSVGRHARCPPPNSCTHCRCLNSGSTAVAPAGTSSARPPWRWCTAGTIVKKN
ncbi:hypothetical protein C0991_012533, partial [Blastosporella zonata]